MSDEDEGDACLSLDALEFDLHLFAQLSVERTEWLIEKEYLRAEDECTSECDALPLSTRELMWKAICDVSQFHRSDRL